MSRKRRENHSTDFQQETFVGIILAVPYLPEGSNAAYGAVEGLSEVCNRIYRLEDVDVLFQCMLFDQMEWEDGKVYGHFSTVYLLKNRE